MVGGKNNSIHTPLNQYQNYNEITGLGQAAHSKFQSAFERDNYNFPVGSNQFQVMPHTSKLKSRQSSNKVGSLATDQLGSQRQGQVSQQSSTYRLNQKNIVRRGTQLFTKNTLQ